MCACVFPYIHTKLVTQKIKTEPIIAKTMEHLDALLVLISLVVWVSMHILISSIGKTPNKSSKYPPGPHPFPIIGNILELGSQPHKALTKLSKTYGPLMSLKLGHTYSTTIVISSPQVAKEVLHKNEQIFSNRAIPDTLKALDHHIFSMAWLPPLDKYWRTLRKVSATKVFSSQKLDSTQFLRQRKVQELLCHVKEMCKKGEALDIGEATFVTVLNSLSNTFFSIDLAHHNSEGKSKEFKEIVWGIVEEGGRPNVVDFFPVFRMLDPQRARAKMRSYFEKLISLFDGLIEERLHLRGLESEPKAFHDVLDSVLEDNLQLSRPHILHLFLDLFVAGLDTTSSSVEWAMTELLRSPAKIDKVREELQRVLGKGEQLEESHISKLPFLRAVVKETLRLHPPVPLLVPRKSEADVEICGFTVPKNAQILVNVWGMGRDSSLWENPNEFMPERFLDSEIDFKGRDFELIPFGAGRRICPGLPLAHRTVHIVLASLLRDYHWKLVNGQKHEDIDMSEKYGFTLHKAQPLKVVPIQA